MFVSPGVGEGYERVLGQRGLVLWQLRSSEPEARMERREGNERTFPNVYNISRMSYPTYRVRKPFVGQVVAGVLLETAASVCHGESVEVAEA